MIVDTATRRGMSGSPVILRSWGQYQQNAGPAILSGGAHSSFVGIYSGRLGSTDKLDAQLGIVWPRFLIDEVIAGRSRDSGH